MNEPSNFVEGSTVGCTKGPLDNPPFTPPSEFFCLYANGIFHANEKKCSVIIPTIWCQYNDLTSSDGHGEW